MKSQTKQNQLIDAGKRAKKAWKVSRESVVQSALVIRARAGSNKTHCPYGHETDAGKLWLEVFETGNDADAKKSEAPAKFGTEVAEEKTEE